MGYGFGGFLVVVGLVLALAVRDSINEVDLVTAGWIIAAVGVAVLLLTAITLNRGGGARTRTTVTDSNGGQQVRETRTDI